MLSLSTDTTQKSQRFWAEKLFLSIEMFLTDVCKLQEFFWSPVGNLARSDWLIFDGRVNLDLTKVGISALLVVGFHSNLEHIQYNLVTLVREHKQIICGMLGQAKS